MKKAIIQMLLALVGHEYLYFDTELKVKKNPHTQPFIAWGACVSPKGDIYLMDADQEWHEVKEEETLILNTLHQRVRFIHQSFTAKQKEVV